MQECNIYVKINYIMIHYNILSYDVASGSVITSCSPLVYYANYMDPLCVDAH